MPPTPMSPHHTTVLRVPAFRPEVSTTRFRNASCAASVAGLGSWHASVTTKTRRSRSAAPMSTFYPGFR